MATTAATEVAPPREAPALPGSVAWVPRGDPTPPASPSSISVGAAASSGTGEVAIGVRTLGVEPDGAVDGAKSVVAEVAATAKTTRAATRRSCSLAMMRLFAVVGSKEWRMKGREGKG